MDFISFLLEASFNNFPVESVCWTIFSRSRRLRWPLGVVVESLEGGVKKGNGGILLCYVSNYRLNEYCILWCMRIFWPVFCFYVFHFISIHNKMVSLLSWHLLYNQKAGIFPWYSRPWRKYHSLYVVKIFSRLFFLPIWCEFPLKLPNFQARTSKDSPSPSALGPFWKRISNRNEWGRQASPTTKRNRQRSKRLINLKKCQY